MSYILDALKRADAERERGAVPGLHARQVALPSPAGHSVRQRVWMAVSTTLALAGIAAGAGLWIWQTPDASVRPAAVQPAEARPPAPLPLAPSAAMPVTPATAASPSSAPQPRPKPEPVAKAAASQTATSAVRLLSDLPENIRRQIPPLAITGSVYSKNPGQRLLLVNNQVLAQGSPVAPEVTLEEIQVKSSVFSFRGTRFRVVH